MPMERHEQENRDLLDKVNTCLHVDFYPTR